MPRYFYEWSEFSDDTKAYGIFDRRRGSDFVMAYADNKADAEQIVDALNAPKLQGVFE